MADEPRMLGTLAIKRITTSTGVILINAISVWTDKYLGLMQGLCIAALVFIIATQLNQVQMQPRLLKRVCLLYCNQEVRRLFVWQSFQPATVFSDILLAIMLAVTSMFLYDLKSDESAQDLHRLLDGLLYLYGDVLDFAFQYGKLKITLCAFGATILLQKLPAPKHKLPAFCWQLARIITANLLSEGMSTMVTAPPQIQLLQYLGSTCLLQLMIPDMQSYLTYIAAQQILTIVPDAGALFFCFIILLDLVPSTSRAWVEDLCSTYFMSYIAVAVTRVPFGGTVLLLVIAHYADQIIQ